MNAAIYFREDMFYPVEFMPPAECGKTMGQQAAEHAELNPGTPRVEDVGCEVLWGIR